MNIQQVPRNKDLKSIFQSKEGYKFVQFDYSQIELRFAGIVGNVSAMINAYNHKEDLHTLMASTITGKPKDEITKIERTRAKAANFGYLYGMMAKTFVQYAKVGYHVEIPIEEATAIRNKFFSTNFELIKYYKDIEQELISKGYITNIFGRRYKVGFENLQSISYRRDYARKGINFTVQSSASDYAIMSIIEIHSKYKNNKDVKIIGSVHDSILFEIKDNGNLYNYIRDIKYIMENPRLANKYLHVGGRLKGFPIPIIVDVEVGAWGKGEEVKL